MTFRYDFNTGAVNASLARLMKLSGKQFDTILRQITARVGVLAEQLTGGYPPQPSPKNPKKPYRRTGRLGASLTSAVEADAEAQAYIAVLGSNVTYAEKVWGERNDTPGKGQAWMHEGVWTPLEEGILQNTSVIERFVVSELAKAIDAFTP